jgi:hypothetical protein
MCSRDPGPSPRSLGLHQKDLDKPIPNPTSLESHQKRPRQAHRKSKKPMLKRPKPPWPSVQKDLNKPILGPWSPSPCIRGPNHLDPIYKSLEPHQKDLDKPIPNPRSSCPIGPNNLDYIYPRSLGPYQKGQNWPIPSPRNPILCARSMSHLHLLRKQGALISKRAKLNPRPLLGGKTPR